MTSYHNRYEFDVSLNKIITSYYFVSTRVFEPTLD